MIPFLKMHGAGNDFVVIDSRKMTLPALDWAKIADRHLGIGCDQVVVLEHSKKADVFMRLFNADGSEAESCGNASRCVAWLLHGERKASSVTIETLAGVIEAQIENERHITVDMGKPGLGWKDIPLASACDTLHLPIAQGELKEPVAVSMGNPHMVFFVDDVWGIKLDALGPLLEKHSLYPQSANVGVAQVLPPSLPPQAGGEEGGIILRVWERGAGLTLACGTAACAALVAAHRRGLTGRKAAVHLPGGALSIEWRARDDHVLMTGPSASSFSGEFDEKMYQAHE